MKNKELTGMQGDIHKLEHMDDATLNERIAAMMAVMVQQAKILEQLMSPQVMLDNSGSKLLMTPTEVGKIFGVNPKTVTRWAKQDKLTSHRTMGGHRRYAITDVRKLYREMTSEAK